MVHNGIIENARSLRDKLTENGTELKSQTDSEALSHIISHLYSGSGPFGIGKNPSTQGDPVESVRQALSLVRGTWGIAVMFSDKPDRIVAARNGSPLVVGVGEQDMFLGSDSHAIAPLPLQRSSQLAPLRLLPRIFINASLTIEEVGLVFWFIGLTILFREISFNLPFKLKFVFF